MKRRATPQLELFGSPKQKRPKSKEPKAVYTAVLFLRSSGARVYRAGLKTSIVNGKRVANASLKSMVPGR